MMGRNKTRPSTVIILPVPRGIKEFEKWSMVVVLGEGGGG